MSEVAGRPCRTTGCMGPVVPGHGYSNAPTFWVRIHPSGFWWPSNIAPVMPEEQGGSTAWRCASCGSSFRSVEGGRFGYERLLAASA
jgi:hypothetical protein